MRTIVLVLAFLIAGSFHALAGTFYDGISAYNQGDYQNALKHWRGLAAEGNAKAQSGLGYLYYKGLGVPQDSVKAATWFYRAAVQGQAEAQTFLGIMHSRGEGVPVNRVLSHMWCDLAVSQGFEQALDCRETATLGMTGAQLKESEDLVIRYRKLSQP